jgi:histidine decarboxylase
VQKSLNLARYAQQQLIDIGVAAWRNENAITVVFPSPSQALQTKWQLASAAGQSHIIAMPGLEKTAIDKFIIDMKNEQETTCGS